MRNSYFHTETPEITTDFLNEGVIVSRLKQQDNSSVILDVALLGYRISRRIGIQSSKPDTGNLLPYSSDNDNISFDCPLLSALFGKSLFFLRGWKQYDSCIKGFNSVGLIAEHVRNQLTIFHEMDLPALMSIKREFLQSKLNENAENIFDATELGNLQAEDLNELNVLDLALWKCFAKRTIVCSTSSNMGISLHQFLRYLQSTEVTCRGRKFNLLGKNEGNLVIWCPDENADFMNQEKSELLRSLELENPPLTKLRTYINRTQRDPGALRDALLCGGYFFPTNPQSVDEVQNLLFVALSNVAAERGTEIKDLFTDPMIRESLNILDMDVQEEKIYVNSGIEGGISGLMIPYLMMLEETICKGGVKGISSWNQASIGAALAAAVIADMIIRNPSKISEHTRSELNTLFPNISKFLENKKLGKDIATRVHGVFDIANLQSLAQLLGVVVEKHLTGRGTAYVGLGSSSYSNGNRCYEILRDSMIEQGCFRGKSTFHPATHTLNPFCQALIYGEELKRALYHPAVRGWDSEDIVKHCYQHAKKAEPAGAAALAGYLLSRLDDGTLSIMEIVYMLRLMGFNKPRFLQFCNLSPDEQGISKFLQEAYEEGIYMGDLAKNIFLLLDWTLEKIEAKVHIEKVHSLLKYNLKPIEDPYFEDLKPHIFIYLTGDNTKQPSLELCRELLTSLRGNKEMIQDFILRYNDQKVDFNSISITSKIFNRISRHFLSMETRIQKLRIRIIQSQVKREAKKMALKIKSPKNEN